MYAHQRNIFILIYAISVRPNYFLNERAERKLPEVSVCIAYARKIIAVENCFREADQLCVKLTQIEHRRLIFIYFSLIFFSSRKTERERERERKRERKAAALA
ncbi:hypothetical protein PUN28_015695 [Cardiocondyla obscurior]|uniref:Uncharacterized protein n=1 Tax=Cardiocondyla obscurior TaxID=286306 RepID=A0AAW2EUB0_9HYME